MNTITSSVLPWGARTFVMGIINLTPDSFSGDGLLRQEDVVAAAVAQAKSGPGALQPIKAIWFPLWVMMSGLLAA